MSDSDESVHVEVLLPDAGILSFCCLSCNTGVLFFFDFFQIGMGKVREKVKLWLINYNLPYCSLGSISAIL